MVDPLTFINLDRPINKFGKSQAVNELISDNTSTDTDHGIVSFYEDNLLPIGNFHFHLLGDQDYVILIGRKPFVSMNFKELGTFLPVH